MAAFVDAALDPAEMVAEIHTLFLQSRQAGLVRRAVVSSEDHQRIARLAGLIQRIEHAPDHIVGLDKEVAVLAEAAFALEFPAGSDGGVGRGKRHVEEEGLILFRRSADPLACPVSQAGQDGLQFPALPHQAGRPEHRIRFGHGWSRGDLAIFQPGVGWEIGQIDTEVVVKAVIVGATDDFLAPVDGFLRGCDLFPARAPGLVLVVDHGVGQPATGGLPAGAKMPLADHTGSVARFLEQLGHRQLLVPHKRLAV